MINSNVADLEQHSASTGHFVVWDHSFVVEQRPGHNC